MHYYSSMIIYLSMLSGAMPMCLLMDFMPIYLRMDFPISRHRLYGCMVVWTVCNSLCVCIHVCGDVSVCL